MSGAHDIGLWQTLRFRDAEAMIGWLEAIGFIGDAVYRNPDAPSFVEHAQMLWPADGGIMFGSERDNPAWPSAAGGAATYLVTDEPDAVFEAAVAAGASVLQPMTEPEYGGRSGSVRDPEGNLWSFGSYRPE